jgi:hypothetical protein
MASGGQPFGPTPTRIVTPPGGQGEPKNKIHEYWQQGVQTSDHTFGLPGSIETQTSKRTTGGPYTQKHTSIQACTHVRTHAHNM